MTTADLLTLCTDINSGDEIASILALSLINIAKAIVEHEREWVVLRTTSSMSVAAGSDTLDLSSMKIDRFRGNYPVVLSDGSRTDRFRIVQANTPLDLLGDEFAAAYDPAMHQITLKRSFAGTLYVTHMIDNDDITTDTTWQRFPSWVCPLLAYMAVAMHKGGIDFDDQNARMASYNSTDAMRFYSMLTRWDNEMQLQMIGTMDPWQSGSLYQSGKIDINNEL